MKRAVDPVRRAIALEFVRELLATGYTVERAEQEVLRGRDKCDGSEQSYVIQHGVIQVPFFDGDKFKFRALADEVLKTPPPQRRLEKPEQLALI